MRAQTSLPVLGVALLLVALAATLGLVVADGVLAGADRDATERQAAVALSERLVDDAAPLTDRQNVVNASRAADLTAERLRDRYGVRPDTAVTVRLGTDVLVQGDLGPDATAFERIVLRRETQTRTVEPNLTRGRAVTLPRRTSNVTLRLAPPRNTTVRTVWADRRTVLSNPDGLRGSFSLQLSRLETTTLRFGAVGSLPPGSVVVRYRPETSYKARLEVRVDA